MSFLPRIMRTLRIARPSLSKHATREVADELAFHLESRIGDLMKRDGLSRAVAEARARREFGDLHTATKRLRQETRRAERRIRLGESLDRGWRDIYLASRGMVRSRGFATATVITLALGMGSTLAIYTVLDSVVLESLPYPASDRLVDIYSSVPRLGFDRWEVTEAGYVHLRAASETLDVVGAYQAGSGTLLAESGAERIEMAGATPELLAVLGARPTLGRLFTPADGGQGGPRVALLSHERWTTSYGADPSVVGDPIRIQGLDWEIAGVLGPGLDLPDTRVDVWVPLAVDEFDPDADSHSLRVIGRRVAGADLAAVQTELDRLTSQFPSLYPEEYSAVWMREAGFRTVAQSLHARVVGKDTRRALWILMGAAALILVIAGANVINLSLVRNLDRAREIRVRGALGASGGHLFRMFVAEGLVLVGAAGLLALGLTVATLRGVRALTPQGLPRLDAVGLDGSAVGFAIGSMAALVLALAALPFLSGRGRGVVSLMGTGERTTAGRRLRAVRAGLVAGQVALALVLLNSAGLLARSFRALLGVDPGFVPDAVVAVDVSLSARGYPDQRSVHAFYRDVLSGVRALPGVAAAGAVSALPLESGLGCYELQAESRPLTEGESPPCIEVHVATAGYFETLRVKLSEGRWLTEADDENLTGALVVTRTLADQMWPNRSPIGEGASIHGYREPWFRVVGVTADLRSEGLDRPPTAGVFFPLMSPEGARRFLRHRSGMTIVTRAAGTESEALIAGIRRAVADVDPGVAVANPRHLEEVTAAARAEMTLATALLAAAAVISLLLGVIGLHGVVSYSVARRTREIGVRMALGAGDRRIRRLVLLASGRLVAIGIAAGLLGAWVAGRLLQGLLFGIPPDDPATLTFVAVLLALVAMLASYVPANRAARVDPASALRSD